MITTPQATAYLKIAEGCDHPCTFCIIPQLRGAFRSRSEESMLMEARALAAAGTKELILIAQDTSMYGRDRGRASGGLARLLERLDAIDGLEWIRLLYLYPATVDDELIEAMASLPKVCTYMDMPLQHAHPDVLRAMRRPSNGERYLEIVDEFRRRIPGVTMRSTFIVGFPGETGEHVAYLEEWIARAQLDRVGFFTYSREDGTPGATLPDQVPAAEKRRRLVRLREAQRLASERARARRMRHDGARAGGGAAPHAPHRSAGARAAGDRSERRALDGRSAGRRRRRSISPSRRPVGTFVDVRLDGCGAFDFYGTQLASRAVPAAS